jgi:hypothetical protein
LQSEFSEMCIREVKSPISSGDVDRIICAMIAIAANGDPTRRWDLIEQYLRAMDDLHEQEQERVRPN